MRSTGPSSTAIYPATFGRRRGVRFPLGGAGASETRSPVSFTFRIRACPSWSVTAETEPGSTARRWYRSRCIPARSASRSRTTSACVTITTVPSGCSSAIARTASTDRACTPRRVSPPGNRTLEGDPCTERHSLVRASRLEAALGQVHAARPAGEDLAGRRRVAVADEEQEGHAASLRGLPAGDDGASRCGGQADLERGADAELAPHGNRPAVVLDHVLHDRQAEAGPSGLARARPIHPVEALEDTREVPA